MGCYDSYYTKCIKCGREIELQTKNGACSLAVYRDGDNIPADVVAGLQDETVRCCGMIMTLQLVTKPVLKEFWSRE